MTGYAFEELPTQLSFIGSRVTQLQNRGMFGFQKMWDVPAALWCAPSGFDARYPEDAHATISMVLSGEPVERLDGRFMGRTGGAEPDLFMLYPGGGPRAYASRGQIDLCHLYIKLEMLEAIATEEAVRPGLGFEVREDRVFARDSGLRVLTDTYLARASDRTELPSTLEMDTRAALIGIHVVRHHSNRLLRLRSPGGTLSRLALNRTLEYIDANLQSNLSLQEVATVAGLSPHYFCAVFFRSVGATPHRYMIGRRIERAKMLMLSPMPLVEIALECGFSSQSHLTSSFARIVGVTPALWRRANAKATINAEFPDK